MKKTEVNIADSEKDTRKRQSISGAIRLFNFINYTNEENYGRIKTDNVMKVVSCFETRNTERGDYI